MKTKFLRFLLFSAMVMSGLPALAHGAAQDAGGGKQDTAVPAPSSQKLETGDEEEYYPGDPFLEMRQMQRAMNRMFNHMLHEPATTVMPVRDSFFSPRLDTYETANAFVVECDLPGMEKDKIDVYFESDRLVIKGIRETEQEPAGAHGAFRTERRFGSFSGWCSCRRARTRQG